MPVSVAMPWLAAIAAPPFFVQMVWLLVAAAAIAFLCIRVGLMPIVGFLVAGVVIGPHALGLVRDQALVDAAAELGVVLLLFTIGIEFSLDKLSRIQRLIFGGGGLQVGLSTALVTGALMAFGVEWRAALFTGLLVALSSTAIVLKWLSDRGETSSAHGQVGIGLLIFQDLAVVVMVLLIPALGGVGATVGAIALALGKAGAIIALVLWLARKFMPPLLESVARTCSPEIFLLTVMAICFGTALLTNLAGVSLSLGAFLAGLMVSESRFREYALGEILPLQVLFSATFFVSVGMLLDLGFVMTHLPLVLGAVALVLAIKIVTTGVSVRLIGVETPVAAAAALMLAQVGEFSFVLERTARPFGLTPAGLGEAGSQAFIAATVVLMIATPFLSQVGAGWASKIERRRVRPAAAAAEQEPDSDLTPEHLAGLENHVIVAGYGEAARRLTRILHGSGIPFLITTLSPGGATEAEADGLPVLRGDATRQRTLVMAGIDRAKMIVIPDDDPATAHRIAMLGRVLNPTMRVVVRTRHMSEIEPLTRDGVDLVVAEELEGIIALFTEVLRDFKIAPEEIDRHQAAVRRGGYAALLAEVPPAVPVAVCALGEHCLESRTLSIHAGAPAAGQKLADLDLESRHAIHVDRVSRNGKEWTEMPDDLSLEIGDQLVLSGSARAFAGAAPLFRSGTISAAGNVVVAPPPIAVAPAVAPVSARGPGRGIDTETTIRFEPLVGPAACAHLDSIRPVRPSARGCEDCLKTGDSWVHLRICLTCGHMGCCDSSPNRHARKHWASSGHPLMRSMEPGETWGWCFADETEIG